VKKLFRNAKQLFSFFTELNISTAFRSIPYLLSLAFSFFVPKEELVFGYSWSSIVFLSW